VYNAAAAAQVRWNRIQDSMARNPTFDFTTPRYFTAYAESAFPYRFFVDGRNQSGQLNLTVARDFFQKGHFPKDFYRRNGSFGLNEISPDIDELFAAHPIAPGHNEGAGNYVLNPEDPGFVGVRSSFDCNEVDICLLNSCCDTLVMLSLYQACKRHGSFAVPESHWRSSDGTQGELGDILQCIG
jgi:hypothetical protein